MKKILTDLHAHSIASVHAYSTIKEIAIAARDAGLIAVGISDHAPGYPGGPDISYSRGLKYLSPIIEGVRVFTGVEADILDEFGSINVPGKHFKTLDYVIASLHDKAYKSAGIELNTMALINTMKNPCVKIIGRPDDGKFPVDYDKLALAANANNVLIEINDASVAPICIRDGNPENQIALLKACKRHGTKVILSSDAHTYYEVGRFDYSLKLIKKVDFPDELIVNFSTQFVEEFTRIKEEVL